MVVLVYILAMLALYFAQPLKPALSAHFLTLAFIVVVRCVVVSKSGYGMAFGYVAALGVVVGSLAMFISLDDNGPLTPFRWIHLISAAPVLVGLLLPLNKNVTVLILGIGIGLCLANLAYSLVR